MSKVGEYVVSIITVSLINSIVSGMLQNSALKGIVKTLCGMVLTVCIIAPVLNFEITEWDDLGKGIGDAVSSLVDEGESLAYDALYDRIKQETEAYIQNKATQLNAEIDVEVILNRGDPPIPIGAVISGSVIPYIRQRLENILETQLGIAKENIEWTG